MSGEKDNADLQWMRGFYVVPAWIGERIAFDYRGQSREGTIVGSSGPHLLVRFDGSEVDDVLHPTWGVRYLSAEAPS